MNRQQQRSEQGYNDPDSDLDFDLEELDPVSSSQSPPPRRQARSSTDYSGRIPLRNLRYGGRRRQRAVEDDLEPLVADEDAPGKREEHAGDDAPLLANGSLRRGSLLDLDAEARSRSWKARLRRLLPLSKRHIAIALADETSEDSTATNRTIQVGSRQVTPYPANAISNAKYTALSFLPVTLWNEFKLFLNLYFLLVALSQVLPALRIGYLSTYVAPLAFVLAVTLGKEGWDDVMRRRRDGEANKEPYVVLRLEGHGRAGTGKGKSLSGSKGGKRSKVDRTAELAREEEAVGGEDEPSARVIEVRKSAKDLAVGDVLVLEKNQRVPADVIILKSIATDAAVSEDVSSAQPWTAEALIGLTEDAGDRRSTSVSADESTTASSDAGGEAFIRTDQLDGETDWKLRVAASLTQSLTASEYLRLRVTAGKPDKRVNDFAGTLELLPKQSQVYDPLPSDIPETTPTITSAPLTIDNTAWANTVLASSTRVHAVVLYTGPQTRAALSTASSRSKIGLLELEINSLVKILCILTAALSLLLVALQRFENDEEERPWYVSVMRFLILFSTIVPISLRVNLDMAKSVYAYLIHRDQGIPGTIVRTSTIPEDLGRIEYLLTDKTGTLTRNEMELRKVHVGSGSYGGEAMDEVRESVRLSFAKEEGAAEGALWTPSSGYGGLASATRTRREIGVRVRDLVLALAICHNVTPTINETANGEKSTSYQASSPDEIAIVQWTEAVGLKVAHRDRRTMTLHFAGVPVVKVEILNIFPFTSDSKRMGIVVRFYNTLTQPGEGIVFYQKGADTVMSPLLAANDYIDEEVGNMAREGLRTLVIGRKALSPTAYEAFTSALHTASLSLTARDKAISRVLSTHLESALHPLGLTAIEDLLQPLIKPSLETLRNAGLKIWMLTGDKPETARSIALSARLVSARSQTIHPILALCSPSLCLPALQPLLASPSTTALLIDGASLALYLSHHPSAFLAATLPLPAVIATRCTPSQKASITTLIRSATGKRVMAIGDGGNDVSMISAADIGIGIEGKEGRQASLAADFSVTQFSHILKLLLWHGRNSYKRSAALGQFVMHRGLLISVAQTVFSIHLAGEPVALYRDWLLVGYATVYTMMPVFSLVLDRDVDERLTNLYPELYHELQAGTSLSYRTFAVWTAISLYQGLVIQLGAQLLAPSPTPGSSPSSTLPDNRMLLLSYTALIINELLMVAASIETWHWSMWVSILSTALLYAASVPFLGGYFSLAWVIETGFWWRLAVLVGGSVGPVYIGGRVRRWVRPGIVGKVRG
ncbi:hypothetical protein B0A48_14735 [Cryoendolithus antarcticus]|uniref:Phospholipid-transporting ATPase n=1 Tax=Cryoendolithus antarcticus TaxID=1507870 RepID=A0A1V8SKJ2_9PEZI|nr:hypothetical protein B0A48_14735 [Cryoendolithus antarcticus]